MATNGAPEDFSDPSVTTALSALAELEKDFAAVELDARKILLIVVKLLP